MSDPIKRPRYFNGQFLDEKDFNLAQDYLIARDSWHGKWLHSPGIADGLNVDAGVGAAQVKVSSGSAMDALGRQIVLVENLVLLPFDKASFANKTVLVVISYSETPSDQADAGARDFTRWQEIPKVEVVLAGTSAPPETTHLRLISLDLDGNAMVSRIDPSVRRLAGARLGNEIELRRLTLSRDGVASSGWPALTCGAANRVDLAGDLQVSRTLQTTGELQVRGPLTIASAGKGVTVTGGDGRIEINSGAATTSPILAVSTPGSQDFFSIYGARQDNQNNDLLWRRGPLRFGTATSFGGQAFSEKMRITEAGNVGIGTANPTGGLHVRNSTATAGALVVENTHFPGFTHFDHPDGKNYIRGTTVLADSAGNVGIGTASPGEKLHVAGNIRLDPGKEIYFAENGQIRSADDNHRILFRRNEDKFEIREFGDILFSPGSKDGKEALKVVMLGNGNVGVGTPAPTGGLHVRNSSAIAGALVVENTHTNGFTHFDYPDGKNYIRGTTILTDLGGNVGVGTANPGEKLHVAGNLKVDGDLRLGGNVVLDPPRLFLVGNSGTGTLFQSPWRNYNDQVYGVAAFFKDSLGVVHLTGLISQVPPGAGSGPVKGSLIFTLPADYRPSSRLVFPVSTFNDTIGRVDVDKEGKVSLETGDKAWVSLDGIAFRPGITPPRLNPVILNPVILNPGVFTPGT